MRCSEKACIDDAEGGGAGGQPHQSVFTEKGLIEMRLQVEYEDTEQKLQGMP